MPRLSFLRTQAFAALLLLATAAGGLAQQAITVSGHVRDSITNQPLGGAIVSLRTASDGRSTRTDDAGAFQFSKVDGTRYTLTVRRLGYEPATAIVEPGSSAESITITMTRVAWLDTVRVRATRQGIYGAVGTSHELKPLPNATVDIFGIARKVPVDALGHFYIAVKTPGAYMMRASASGFAAQTMSVTVQRDEGSEVALLLDSATGPASHMFEAAFADFYDRMLVRRPRSAIIPRSELTRDGDHQLLGAIRRSPAFLKVVLRFGEYACVFIDGQPKPGVSVNALDPADIEAVETYAAGAEASGTLGRRWPRGFPCAPTGGPAVSPGNDVVYWVVIWTKR
jgi:hypothetical protein